MHSSTQLGPRNAGSAKTRPASKLLLIASLLALFGLPRAMGSTRSLFMPRPLRGRFMDLAAYSAKVIFDRLGPAQGVSGEASPGRCRIEPAFESGSKLY